jgi:hypothetical protein
LGESEKDERESSKKIIISRIAQLVQLNSRQIKETIW